MNQEPVWTIAGITSVAVALLSLIAAFGIPITEEQEVAVIGFVGTVAPLVLAYFARKRVTPVEKLGRRRGRRGTPEI
jgi:hypothetical protein